jgi:hypothetical protein
MQFLHQFLTSKAQSTSMATKRSGTVFVQTGQVVQEEPVIGTEVIPADDPEAQKAREQIQEIKDQRTKLATLANHSTVIFEAQAVFPFQMFPDRIIVEKDKVTLIHRTFAWKNVFPVLISNLNGVTVTRSFLFASLSLELTGYENNPDDIMHLRPSDAAKAKRYILGLIHAQKQGIDLSKIPIEELKDDLEEIGKTTGEIETLPMT